MSLLTNSLFILFAVTFGSAILCPIVGIPVTTGSNYFISGGNPSNCQSTATSQSATATAGCAVSDFPIWTLVLGTIGLTGVSAVAASLLGTFTFLNPFTIFASFVVSFILTFLPLPYQAFNALPYPLNLFLVGAFGLSLTLGIIYFYHGTGEN